MFGRQQGDEQAWHAWQRLAPYMNCPPPPAGPRGQSAIMLGKVQQVYQNGRRGDKAMVNFGIAGVWDTWWEGMRPRSGNWVLVSVHLWIPPGTHSGQPVLWVDNLYEAHPGDLAMRAERHTQRLSRDQEPRERRSWWERLSASLPRRKR
jgi:hypothetical protein